MTGESITFMCGTDTFDGEITDVQVATETSVGQGTTTPVVYSTVPGINSYNPQADLDGNGFASGVLTLATTDSLQVGDFLLVPTASQTLFGGADRLEILYLLSAGTKVGVQYQTTNPVSSGAGVTIPPGLNGDPADGITFTAIRETTSSTTTISEFLDVDLTISTAVGFTGTKADFASTGGYGHNVLAGTDNPPNPFGAILGVSYDGTATPPNGWAAAPSWNPGWGTSPYTGNSGHGDIVDEFYMTDGIINFYSSRVGWPIPQQGEYWKLDSATHNGVTTSGIYQVSVQSGGWDVETVGFGSDADGSEPLEWTGTQTASYKFNRIDTTHLAVGCQGALNSYINDAFKSGSGAANDFLGSFVLSRLNNQNVVGADTSGHPVITSTFSGGVFENILKVPLSVFQTDVDGRYTSSTTVAGNRCRVNRNIRDRIGWFKPKKKSCSYRFGFN